MPFIKCVGDDGTERFLKLPDDRTLVFGRETYCDYQLRLEAEISREHFSITPGENAGVFEVVDLGSRNGTFLNGKRLGNDDVELREGDEIRAGTQRFVYFKNMPSGDKRRTITSAQQMRELWKK
jgi:pSer/pThr/pTyr-binding forkhead associated (FHA) protein